MQGYDIELALVTLSSTDANEVSRLLPKNYLIEHRQRTGWGYVLRLPDDDNDEWYDNAELSGELNKRIIDFLVGLTPVMKWVKSSSSVLRVAVFNDKVTCTIKLDAFDMFASFDIKLALTVYPVGEMWEKIMEEP